LKASLPPLPLPLLLLLLVLVVVVVAVVVVVVRPCWRAGRDDGDVGSVRG